MIKILNWTRVFILVIFAISAIVRSVYGRFLGEITEIWVLVILSTIFIISTALVFKRTINEMTGEFQDNTKTKK